MKDIPDTDHVFLGVRLIFAIKNFGTNEEHYKARFMAQGSKCYDSIFHIHFEPTVKYRSLLIQLTIGRSNIQEVTSVDVDYAFT